MPLLSLMVPTYNRLAMFKICLDSLRQTTVDAEIIVLNNGSTDGTKEYLDAIQDPRLRVYHHESNQPDPYNVLFGLARGEYMAWMGDDDWALPGGYEALVDLLLRHPDVDLAYSLGLRVDGTGRSLGPIQWPGLLGHAYVGTRDEFSDLIVACYLSPQTAVYRRSLYQELGGFDPRPGFWGSADWDMMLRYVFRRKTAFLPVPTVAIRFHDQSNTEAVGKRDGRFAEGRIALWRKWLLEHPEPVVLGDFVWRSMLNAFVADLRHEFGDDTARIETYLQQLNAIRNEVGKRENRRALEQVASSPTMADLPQSDPGIGKGLPRVLLLAQHYYPPIGGGELTFEAWLGALRDAGIPVEVLCHGTGTPLQRDGIWVHYGSDGPDIERFVAAHRPDLIITGGFWTPLAVEVGHRHGVPVWSYLQSIDHFCPDAPRMAHCDRNCPECPSWQRRTAFVEAQKQGVLQADRIFVNSGFLGGQVEAFIGRKDWVCIPPAIVFPALTGERTADFITLSTATRYKGLDTFLEISRHMPDQRFLLVGRGDPESEGIDLREYPNVESWGWVEPSRFLEASRMVLVPTVGPEAFGRVGPEAQAAGAIPIVSGFGGGREAIGEGGLVVEAHLDPMAWVQAIRKVLGDPALEAGLREKAAGNWPRFRAEHVARAFLDEVLAAFPSDKTPVRVHWEGSQFAYHSLAHVNRQLCLGLLASGEVDLSVIPYKPDQFNGAADPAFQPLAACVGKSLAGPAAVHVRHQWPPTFEPPKEGAWVMIQPWEFGGIPGEWVSPMRDQVDEIWVPSHWVKDCYVQSGIPAEKVCVVRNGVDCHRFTPEGPCFHLNTKRRFKFLFLGGTIHRKGIDVLLGAYLEAFRAGDDVCLVIKGQGGTTYRGSELHATLEKIKKEDPDAPEILYLTENLDESALASLYRACDVFVMPYRGEGFGLPMAEAMACGLPVMATERGAAMDFLAEDRAWLIPCTRQSLRQVDQFQPSRAGFWLEEPSQEALVDLLRQVVSRPDEVSRKGQKAREFAMNHLGWEEPSSTVLSRIRSLARKTPLRIKPPAPANTREAFLYRPDWSSSEWVEVLLAFVTAFQPGDPVGLILLLEGSGRTEAEVQEAILHVITQAGIQAFPDVVIIAHASDTVEALEGFQEIRWITKGMGQPAGSARMERLKAAHRRLKQGPV